MAIGKWIGGFLGFAGGGPLGAFVGFCFGAVFDKMMDAVNTPESQPKKGARSAFGQNKSYAYTQQRRHEEEGDRNSFFFSLLVLSSYIINADGKIMHSEMEYVRNFLRNNWGEAARQQGNDILMKLFAKQKEIGFSSYHQTIVEACLQIRANMDYVARMQLLRYLYEVALADGVVTHEEKRALGEVAQLLAIKEADANNIFGSNSNSGNDLDKAYRTMGISSSATDDEVRHAYRHMVLLYHSDRLSDGASDEKIKEINAAKELIYKARNIK